MEENTQQPQVPEQPAPQPQVPTEQPVTPQAETPQAQAPQAPVPKKSKKGIFAAAVGVVAIAVLAFGGWYAYDSGLLNFEAEESPPSLTLGGAQFQGKSVETTFGFLRFEAGDKYEGASDPVFKAASKGVNYYYSKDDTSFDAVVKSIKPKEDLKILVAFYDAEEPWAGNATSNSFKLGCFKVYPVGPYEHTCEVAKGDLGSTKIGANRSFAIIASDKYEYNSNMITEAKELAAELTIPDFKGWTMHPIASTMDLTDPKIRSIWIQKSANEFEKLRNVSSLDISREYKMAWLLLGDPPIFTASGGGETTTDTSTADTTTGDTTTDDAGAAPNNCTKLEIIEPADYTPFIIATDLDSTNNEENLRIRVDGTDNVSTFVYSTKLDTTTTTNGFTYNGEEELRTMDTLVNLDGGPVNMCDSLTINVTGYSQDGSALTAIEGCSDELEVIKESSFQVAHPTTGEMVSPCAIEEISMREKLINEASGDVTRTLEKADPKDLIKSDEERAALIGKMLEEKAEAGEELTPEEQAAAEEAGGTTSLVQISPLSTNLVNSHFGDNNSVNIFSLVNGFVLNKASNVKLTEVNTTWEGCAAPGDNNSHAVLEFYYESDEIGQDKLITIVDENDDGNFSPEEFASDTPINLLDILPVDLHANTTNCSDGQSLSITIDSIKWLEGETPFEKNDLNISTELIFDCADGDTCKQEMGPYFDVTTSQTDIPAVRIKTELSPNAGYYGGGDAIYGEGKTASEDLPVLAFEVRPPNSNAGENPPITALKLNFSGCFSPLQNPAKLYVEQGFYAEETPIAVDTNKDGQFSLDEFTNIPAGISTFEHYLVTLDVTEEACGANTGGSAEFAGASPTHSNITEIIFG